MLAGSASFNELSDENSVVWEMFGHLNHFKQLFWSISKNINFSPLIQHSTNNSHKSRETESKAVVKVGSACQE